MGPPGARPDHGLSSTLSASIITLWIGSLVLGLLALAFLAYRLWKCYPPSPHPDTSSCTLL